MLISSCLMETITEWFDRILTEYKITPAEIHRRTGVSESHMSKVLKGERGLGEKTIRKIAKAVNVAPEVFLRQVGFSSPVTPHTEQREKLLYLFSLMPLDEQDRMIRYLQATVSILEQEGKIKRD